MRIGCLGLGIGFGDEGVMSGIKEGFDVRCVGDVWGHWVGIEGLGNFLFGDEVCLEVLGLGKREEMGG